MAAQKALAKEALSWCMCVTHFTLIKGKLSEVLCAFFFSLQPKLAKLPTGLKEPMKARLWNRKLHTFCNKAICSFWDGWGAEGVRRKIEMECKEWQAHHP